MATKKYKFLARTSHGIIGDIKNLDEEVAKAYGDEYLVETDEPLTEGEELEESGEDEGIESLSIDKLKALAKEKKIDIPKEIKKKDEIVEFLKIELEKLKEESGEDENK